VKAATVETTAAMTEPARTRRGGRRQGSTCDSKCRKGSYANPSERHLKLHWFCTDIELVAALSKVALHFLHLHDALFRLELAPCCCNLAMEVDDLEKTTA
jgi:hypothetical protein